jgi:putative hemolysin
MNDLATVLFWLITCVVTVLLGGIFAGFETGLYLTHRVRAELLAEGKSTPAIRLHGFFSHMDRTLAMLLIGVNVFHYIAAFSVTTLCVLADVDDVEFVASLITVPLMFIFSESVPKGLFQRGPEKLTYLFARPVYAFSVLFRWTGMTPLVTGVSTGLLRLIGRKGHVTDTLGRETLIGALAEGQAAGTLTGSQEEMARRVMDLAALRVADVTHPLDQAVTVCETMSREEFIPYVAGHVYSRLPMLDADGRITGVVDALSVLTDVQHRSPMALQRTALFVSCDETITDALFHLRRDHQHLAGVVNADGEHIGIVTSKDLVEAVVGDLVEW